MMSALQPSLQTQNKTTNKVKFSKRVAITKSKGEKVKHSGADIENY